MTGCLIWAQSPVAHKISSGEVPEGGKFAEEFLVLVHGYLHPIRLPSSHILGVCSSWKLRLCHKMIFYFCHRIASECMMVISSGQCVFVVSLFVLFLPIVDIRHWPLTWDMWHRSSSSRLLMLAESIYRGYSVTEAVMNVGNIMVTCV